MVKWDFSVESGTNNFSFPGISIEENSFSEALNKISVEQLEKVINIMEKQQKQLDEDRKKEVTLFYEVSIGIYSNYGKSYPNCGTNLKSIKADSIKELIEKLNVINVSELTKKAKAAINDDENKEMFALQDKVTFNGCSFPELNINEVKQLLEKRENGK
jgi:hypothetical protein